MEQKKLIKVALILLILVLIVVILKYGKPFLVPLTFAALISMLLLPLAQWMERKGINKALSTIFAILVFVLFFALVGAFAGWQISNLSKDAGNIEQQVSEKYQQVRDFVTEKLGIPPEKQKQMMQEQQSSSGGKLSGTISGIIAGIGGFFGNSLLVLVYIFLFIYFRGYLKRFILRIVPDTEEEKAEDVLHKSQKVTQKYLTGLTLMIISLWIMYSIGFSIAGVKNAFFFAILCGLLEIVPFVGNLIGNTLTILMALVQGGDMNIVIGILITYAVVQFFQSYVLEPLVVGSEVNINPLFTIVGLVAGEVLWGIPGMVLAIPVLGVTKIVCDHITPLKPYGELIGEDKKEHKGFKKKMKELAGKARSK